MTVYLDKREYKLMTNFEINLKGKFSLYFSVTPVI